MRKLIGILLLFLVATMLLTACGGGGGTSGGGAPTLVSIAVTPACPSIALGKTRQLTATGMYSDDSTKDITAAVTWGTSDQTKATVNAGLITTVAVGPVTISASSGEISGSAKVAVSAVALPRTGQTVSHASGGIGDDGALKYGVGWPSPRFTDNTDGTVTDKLTGLMWLKNANCIATNYAGFDNDGTSGDGAVGWQHALDFVAGINSGAYMNCGGGHTDWRLPNREELRSLLNYGQTDPGAWLLTQGFSNVQPWYYWSSTTYAATNTEAWYVYMGSTGWVNGIVNKSGNDNFVWPVRSGAITATISLPSTGQTVSFAAGDDGAVQKGVAWPSPRFTTNADTTVTDNLTGLLWSPDGNVIPARDNNWDQDGTANDGAVTWQHALDYVSKLNADNYLGYNDWRLPNVNEIESLMDAGRNSPALPAGHPFANVQANYWSSTTYAATNTGAWVLSAISGVIGADSTHFYNYVWPVRAGQ